MTKSFESNQQKLFYDLYYDKVFGKEGFSGKAYSWTHSLLESTFSEIMTNKSTCLEIGAGKGQHLEFVKHPYASYTMLDLQEPPKEFPYSKNFRLKWVKADVVDHKFSEQTFDRIISMCVLHHVTSVQGTLENIHKWLAPGGTFSLFLPSDPGLMNRINRSIFITPKMRRLRFSDWQLVVGREHRNHYWGIRNELNNTFSDCLIIRKYYPFRIPASDLSLFSIWHIKKPLL